MPRQRRQLFRTALQSGMSVRMRVGVAKRDITPPEPVPLGGYFTVRPRMGEHVLDPVYVRALAFEQDSLRVVLLIYDLVLITVEMTKRIGEALEKDGARAICIATHTHSAPGGYWQPLAARLALGPHRLGAAEELIDAGVGAAREALADLGDARWSIRNSVLTEVAVNRRDEEVLPDDVLWALRAVRRDDEIILCGYPSHPVVVAERDLHAVSADFPGRVVSRLEEEVAFAAFINGPVGGTGTYLLDEVRDPQKCLELQADPIAAEALMVRELPLRENGELRFASRWMQLPARPAPRASFDDQFLGRVVTWPLDRLAHRLFWDAHIDAAPIQALAFGKESILVGTPADLGINVGRAIRNAAAVRGFRHPFVASQADGYIGYLHRRDEYRYRPDSKTLGMAMYENLMGIFGRNMGEDLIVEANNLLDELLVSELDDELR